MVRVSESFGCQVSLIALFWETVKVFMKRWIWHGIVNLISKKKASKLASFVRGFRKFVLEVSVDAKAGMWCSAFLFFLWFVLPCWFLIFVHIVPSKFEFPLRFSAKEIVCEVSIVKGVVFLECSCVLRCSHQQAVCMTWLSWLDWQRRWKRVGLLLFALCFRQCEVPTFLMGSMFSGHWNSLSYSNSSVVLHCVFCDAYQLQVSVCLLQNERRCWT